MDPEAWAVCIAVLSVVLLFGTLFVAQGWIAAADVLPFVLVTPGLCGPLLLLHYITHELSHATGAARRVQALLQTPVLEAPAPDMQQSPKGCEVRFEGVGHAYDAEHQVLTDVSFCLAPGSTTAIVGRCTA